MPPARVRYHHNILKQECIPIGCVPPTVVPTIRCTVLRGKALSKGLYPGEGFSVTEIYTPSPVERQTPVNTLPFRNFPQSSLCVLFTSIPLTQ